MAERNENNTSKRIILLPPERDFLNQFSRKSTLKRIVLTRKDDPNVFPLNEWPSNKLLKYLLIIPFVVLLFSLAILFLISILPIALFSKDFVKKTFEKFLEKFKLFAVNKNEELINNSIDAYARIYYNQSQVAATRRILYLHSSDIKVILKIDFKKVYQFIDEIWLYEKIEEIYEKCFRSNYYLEHSYIVLNKQTEANYINIAWLNAQNENIIQAAKREEDWNNEIAEMLKPKTPRITLKQNNILSPDIVYYHESEFNPEINSYLFENYDRINKALESNGLHFMYLPKLLQQIELSVDTIIPFIEYLFPDLFKGNLASKQELIKEIFKNIDASVFGKSLKIALEIPDQPHPAFIHSVDLPETLFEYKTFQYSIFYLDNILEIDNLIEFYINHVRIATNNAFYQLVNINPDDPDEVFSRNKDYVADELSKVITNIKRFKNEKIIIGSLVYIINNLKDSQPALCENLNKVLYQTISNTNHPLSRLVIDEKHRIFLSDYDNIEIELTPLPKTLFIFMLRHPEGLLLKELYLHRKELIEIYGEIGNRLDMSAIQKSIYDMTDARSNSINEKCSRIKEAFISKIDDSLARNYYITGTKSEPKSIILDRSLVIFLQKV